MVLCLTHRKTPKGHGGLRLCLLRSFLLIYLHFGCAGLRCCSGAFSNCEKQGLTLGCGVHSLLIAMASLAVAHRL